MHCSSKNKEEADSPRPPVLQGNSAVAKDKRSPEVSADGRLLLAYCSDWI